MLHASPNTTIISTPTTYRYSHIETRTNHTAFRCKAYLNIWAIHPPPFTPHDLHDKRDWHDRRRRLGKREEERKEERRKKGTKDTERKKGKERERERRFL